MKKFIVGGSVIVLGYLFYKFSTLKKSEIKKTEIKTSELTKKEKESLKKREDLYRMYLKDDSAGFNPYQGEISLDMLNGYMYSLNRKNKK